MPTAAAAGAESRSYPYASYRYHDFDAVDLASGDVISADGNLQPNARVNVLRTELRFAGSVH